MLSKEPFRDVVLLGAGASRAAGLPSAAGFTEHLLAASRALRTLSVSPEVLDEIYKDLVWLQDTQARLHPISQKLNGFNPNNIEDIFRVWGHERIQSKIQISDLPDNLIPGYQYPRLIRMLALALAYSPKYLSARDFHYPNIYSWLVEQLVGNKDLTQEGTHPPIVVTTNYDLLIEFAISARSDVDLTYTYSDYYGLQNIFHREQTARCIFHYLKLHGSINWWGERPGFRVNRDAVRNTIICDNPLVALAERYISAGDDIEMVPPAILKDTIYRANWVDVWDEAYTAFCTCRQLIIIGYSFSQGDILAHNMLTLGLARSPYLKSIIVIDPNANEVLSRIKNYFSEDFISSKKWISYEHPFDDDILHWAPSNLFFSEKK